MKKQIPSIIPDKLPKGVLTADGVHLNPKGTTFVVAEMGKVIGIAME